MTTDLSVEKLVPDPGVSCICLALPFHHQPQAPCMGREGLYLSAEWSHDSTLRHLPPPIWWYITRLPSSSCVEMNDFWKMILQSLSFLSGRLPYALHQQSLTFLAPGASFVEGNFSTDWRGGGVVSGWFKCMTFIVHFIAIIITSAPPQIIRH